MLPTVFLNVEIRRDLHGKVITGYLPRLVIVHSYGNHGPLDDLPIKRINMVILHCHVSISLITKGYPKV